MELWETINEWYMANNLGMRAMKPANIKSELTAIMKENGLEFRYKQEKVNGNSGKKICNVVPTSKAHTSWPVKSLAPTKYSLNKSNGALGTEKDETHDAVTGYLLYRNLYPVLVDAKGQKDGFMKDAA